MEELLNSTSREYWRNVIRECKESGMSKSEWMNLHNINSATFYRWQRILSNKDEEENEESIVCLEEPEVVQQTIPSVTVTKNDIRVEIHENISDKLLQKIMRALNNA